MFIYILLLEDDKYYIGKTQNPKFGLDHHNNLYCSWTQKYNPIKLLELISNCDDFDEDKYTLKYMERYGINNVRGGSFCSIELTENEKTTIQKMITCSTNKCLKCDEHGHLTNECILNYSGEIQKMLNVDEYDNYMNDYYQPPIEIVNEIKIQNLFGWNDNRTYTIKIYPIISQNMHEIKKNPFTKSMFVYILKKIISGFQVVEGETGRNSHYYSYYNFIKQYNKFIKYYKTNKSDYDNYDKKISDAIKILVIYLYGKQNIKSISSSFELYDDNSMEDSEIQNRYRNLRSVGANRKIDEFVLVKINIAGNVIRSKVEYN
jgi:hypothetical protein